MIALIKDDGTLWKGYLYPPYNFTQIGTDNDWKDLNGAHAFLMIIKNNGTLWNINNLFSSSLPILINNNPWKEVALISHSFPTYAYMLGLRDNGTIWEWDLFAGNPNIGTIPIQKGASSDWIKLSNGDQLSNHILLINSIGNVYGLYDNTSFNLGLGYSSTIEYNPIIIGTLNNIQSVGTGSGGSFAIKNNGSYWAAGLNNLGKLGDGSISTRMTFSQIGTETWKSMSYKSGTTWGIKTNGTLWTWGNNILSPIQVGVEFDWKEITSGLLNGISCGFKENSNALWRIIYDNSTGSLTVDSLFDIGNCSNLGNPNTNSLACDDHIQVSLDSNCCAIITPDMVLEGNYPLNCLKVVLKDKYGNVIPSSPKICNQFIGQLISYSLVDTCTGNSCWGTLVVEDELPP
ncbi:MAG: hypothetical protein IPG55_00085 [Saprospiraceae bacterium]|nr:hypothetical protein [Candidatus Defluviibacterium haderslevense]